jgi:hypothetical protein
MAATLVKKIIRKPESEINRIENIDELGFAHPNFFEKIDF